MAPPGGSWYNMRMAESGLIKERVGAWRREYVRSLALDASSLLVVWGLAAAAAALWIDAALVLPKEVRAGALAAGFGAAAAGLWRLLIHPLLRMRWRLILDAAEARFPSLKSHLGTAFDFLTGPGQEHTSPQLRLAHIKRTERLLAATPPSGLFPWRPSASTRRGAAAAFLAGISLPWVPGGPAWERLLAPWRERPLEAFVTIFPGDAIRAWGDPALIEARLTADAPPTLSGAGELTLRVRGAGDWRDTPWDDGAGRSASFRVGSLSERLEYRLSWRGLSSRTYALEPAPRPQWAALTARVHTPHGATFTVRLDVGEALEVPRGSWVILSGIPNAPLAGARLLASWQAAPIPVKTISESAYEAGFQALEDGGFRFELQSRAGLYDSRPVEYALRTLADNPPSVDLLYPADPAQAGPEEPFLVSFAGRDDFGLSRLVLKARPRTRDGLEHSIALAEFAGGEAPKEFIGDHPLDLAAFPPGTVIELQIQAFDNARPPRAALSAKQTVEVVDFEGVHKDVRERWLKAQGTVQNLLSRQRELAELSSRQEALGPSTGPVLSLIRERLEDLPADWESASSSLEELARSMKADAFSNPGLTEELAAASESLDGARRRDLPPALESSQKGAWPEAKRRHEGLARRLEAALRSLEEGLGVQELQDMNADAARLSRSGSELQAALESMSENRGRSPTGAERERLRAALERLGKGMEALSRALAAMPRAMPGGPEEGRRVVELPLNAARAKADALSSALARGDYAEAARLAGELSEQLEKIQSAVSAGGQSLSAGRGGGSKALEGLQEHWSKVVEEQARSLEEAQALDQGRMSAELAAQKELLEELKSRQSALVSSAAAWGGSAFPQEALAAMGEVRREFEGAKVRRAPELLRGAAAHLRRSAAAAPPSDAARLDWFADQEDQLRRLLEAPASPGPVSPEGLRKAAARQAEVGAQTQELQLELEAVERELGVLPGSALEDVRSARREQSGAEESLGQGDAPGAVRHEAEALSLLDKGRKQLSQALGRQQGIESSMGQPFLMPSSGGGGRAGRGGRTGSDLGSVPMPKVQDYRPPRRIRDELQKSLREKRPAGIDPVVKEYFKRLTQ